MTTLIGETAITAEPEIGFLDEAINELADDPEFTAEGRAIEFTEQIARAMKSQGVTKAELGRRMGVSRAYTTRILDAPPNLTLLSIAKVALSLGLTVQIHAAEAAPEKESPNSSELQYPAVEVSSEGGVTTK